MSVQMNLLISYTQILTVSCMVMYYENHYVIELFIEVGNNIKP